MIEFNATFIVAMLSFVVFILIMNAIFYNPILSIIRKREEYISSNTQKAEQFENTAKEYEQTHAKKIEEKQDECRVKFKESISLEQNMANAKIDTAKELSKNEILKQKEALHTKEESLRSTVKQTVVVDLASDITKKITQGVLN